MSVADVSLQVGRGQVVGLLGPNGAGKTSVITMLLGLVRPDAGEVVLLGRPATDPASRARVGYLAWAAVWVTMVWGLAAASFGRKDL